MAELKPCPFCGGACGISRKEQSKFTVRQGELVFEQNGYKKLKDRGIDCHIKNKTQTKE